MKKVSLSELASVIAGQSPDGKSYNKDGNGIEFHQGKKSFGVIFLNHSGIWTTEPKKVAEPGDIVMSVRAPVGNVNFVTSKISIGRGLAAIRPNKNIDRNFLFYFLRFMESRINGHDGATFNSINKTEIEAIKIPISEIDHQRLIVSKLDQAFEAIDQAIGNSEKRIENLKELKMSISEKAFKGELI